MELLLNLANVTRMQVLLRNPESWDADGRSLVPEPFMLQWSDVPWRPLRSLCYDETDPDVDPLDDLHCATACPACIDSWAADHWLRVWAGDQLLVDTQVTAFGPDGGSVL